MISNRECLLSKREELQNNIEVLRNEYKNYKKIIKAKINDLESLEKSMIVEICNSCIADPKIGDFWHELFCPVLVVVDILENGDLIVCRHTKELEDGYIFDVSKCKKISREEFEKIARDLIMDNNDCTGVIPERVKGIFEQWHEWTLNQV